MKNSMVSPKSLQQSLKHINYSKYFNDSTRKIFFVHLFRENLFKFYEKFLKNYE